MILQVGVKAVLKNNEGKILLLKRSLEKYGTTSGEWDIPGGRIDAGTSLLDNLAREVTEETNLTLISVPKLIAAQDILLGEARHIVRLTYTVFAEGELVLDTSENTEYRWVSFEALTDLQNDETISSYLRLLLSEGILTEHSWD